MARTSWTDIVDALYEGSWNSELSRFRSPFVFRGQPSTGQSLSSTLIRLANGRADPGRLEMALLRNFRKYGHGDTARSDSIWHWLARRAQPGEHRLQSEGMTEVIHASRRNHS